jgi:hypothetical protein
MLRHARIRQGFLSLYLSDATVTSKDSADALDYIHGISESLAIDPAKGFGPWQILISGPASRFLHSERRRSAKDAEIILRKIR